MKKMKKIASLLLALALSASLAVPAMAGDITIGNAVAGEDYTAYKLFDVTYANQESKTDEDIGTVYTGGNFTYTIKQPSNEYTTLVNAGYKADSNNFGIKFTKAPASAGENVYFVEPADKTAGVTEQNAKDLAAALNAIKDDSTKFLLSGESVTADGTSATITVEEDGYYFVDSSLGAVCGLNTTTPDVTINEKNDNDTDLVKTVEDANSEAAAAINSYIGQTVTYTVVVSIPETADGDYVVTDVLDNGLTFDADSIKCNAATGSYEIDTAPTTTATIPEGSTLIYSVTIDGAKNAGETVTITYTAVVNENVTVNEVNANTATVTYGHNQSIDDTATVTTFDFDLVKYTSGNVLLEGAEFELYEGTTLITFTVDEEGNYRVDPAGETTRIEVGTAHIYGLDAGAYTLKEVVVPDGYNAAADTEFSINNEGAVTGLEAVTVNGVDYEVGVENNSGAVMPSTGGIGTTIFYVVGGMLVVCAGVVLVSKKRMGAN